MVGSDDEGPRVNRDKRKKPKSTPQKFVLSAFDRLMDALSADKLPDADTIARMGFAAYEEFVGEYRPLIKALPMLTQEVGADMAPMITAFVTFTAALRSDDLVEALGKIATTRAKIRYANYVAYIDAGFSREHAFELCKLDAASGLGVGSVISTLPQLASMVEVEDDKDKDE